MFDYQTTIDNNSILQLKKPNKFRLLTQIKYFYQILLNIIERLTLIR